MDLCTNTSAYMSACILVSYPDRTPAKTCATRCFQPTSALVLLLVLCLWLWYREQRSRDILSVVPGPPCLPVIGSVLSVGSSPHTSLQRLWKSYGDVFRIQIGSVPVLVLNGIQVIRNATVEQGDVFSGRPDLLTFRLASEGKSMAFNSFSPEWKQHRRIAERALRLLASEGEFLKRVVTPEANLLAQEMIAATCTGPYNPSADVIWSAAHVMYSMCYGRSRDAPDFRCMVDTTLRLVKCHKLGNALNFFPWLRRFMKNPYNELRIICNRMAQTTKSKEQEHLETYKEHQLRDAMDALIRLGVEQPCGLQRDQVLHTVQEFIGAGMDIISTSLLWAVLYMAKFPEIRKKMVEEIYEIVGRGHNPTEADLRKLPYTTAFVLESLRFSCVVPLALPHSTLADTTISGYHVPAGTMILINLCSVQWDPVLWGDPERFRPERFIDPATGALDDAQVHNCGAFGFGRRRCIGEQLGKQQLVLYVATLLQQCRFVDSECHVECSVDSGIVLRPNAFAIRVESRC